MALPLVNQSIWLSDKQEGWIPATVKDIDGHTGSVTVKMQSGEEIMLPRSSYSQFLVGSPPSDAAAAPRVTQRRKSQLSRRQSFASSRDKKILPRDASGRYGREGYDDMDNLPYLHEASVLNNIKHRFQMNLIYTSTGPILIAMNPFKWLDIYGDDTVQKYRNAVDLDKTPSHCYRVAEQAYRDIFSSDKNRSIIICGESGAGKTETTKLMLHYFSLLADEKSFETSIEKRVMDSNPLLEAFGNAKTVRNNNSSRFGKFISIYFDKQRKKLVSGSVINYLLEKSRSVVQPELERNFHIFYQLCQGADDKLRKKLKINLSSSYDYLNQSGCLEVDSISDEEEFHVTQLAMKTLGLTLSQQLAIFKLISGHLHLGNVKFVEGASEFINIDDNIESINATHVLNMEALEDAAEMYGVESTSLYNAIVTRTITPPDGKPVIKQLDVEQAVYTRNAFAKHVYSEIFDWLVDRVNGSLQSSNEQVGLGGMKSIGILDIYGFESLLNNGLEQLLINYANETLQSIFNSVIFEGEKSLYLAEGIKWDVSDFPDNSECLGLIQHRSTGILAMLNEECLLGHGTDLTFCRKITNTLTSFNASHFSACGPSTKWRDPATGSPTTEMQFVVRHYAGDIIYTSEFFVEKNRDTVSQSLKDLCSSSTNSVLSSISKDLVPNGRHADGRNSNGHRGQSELHSTLGMAFRKQLKSMVEVIKGTKPVFLRCIKSNNFLKEKICDSMSVLRQLRCNGVLAALDMRRAGFPTRILYKDFCERYHVLAKSSTKTDGEGLPVSDDSNASHWKYLAKSILANKMVIAAGIEGATRLGITRIFFRSGTLGVLDTTKEAAMRARIVYLQAFFRGQVARSKFSKIVICVRTCQRLLRGHLARKSRQEQLRTAKRRARFNIVAKKVASAQAELENIDLVAKESLVTDVQEVTKYAKQAQTLLDSVKYALHNEKGGKISSDGEHVQEDLKAALDVIQLYSKSVRENVAKRAEINDARKSVGDQLVNVRGKYDDVNTMYEALSSINGVHGVITISDSVSDAMKDALKAIKACEEILLTDNSKAYVKALEMATNSVTYASDHIEKERRRINIVTEERASALTSLSEIADKYSKSKALADTNSLWSSAHVQSTMDEAQRAINDVEIVINKSEEYDTYRGMLKDLAGKISESHSVVLEENDKKKIVEKEIAVAEQTLKTCSRRLYDIQESVNESGISDLYNVKSAKQVAENAISTARRCSVSSSASAFVAAVNLAVGEIGKAEDICKIETEKKYKLDKDRQNGQSHLEPSIDKFSSIRALVKVNGLSSVSEVKDAVETAERAIGVAVKSIESGTASEIHSAVANAVSHVNACEIEVFRVQDARLHLEEQRKKALEMLQPAVDELNIVKATVEVSNLSDAPHVANALQAAAKSVEDAEITLKKGEASHLDRFNSVVLLAIEKVKVVSNVMQEEKESRDKWTREKRRLWKALEPLVDECSALDSIITDGSMHEIEAIEDGMASAHKAIDYIRQILRNGRADNAVVASTAIEDVASKLLKVRALITVEQKRKSEEERVLLQAKKKMIPVKDQLAQAIGSIEVNGLREVDMVREALEAAKVAVTTAQDTISVNSSAASALTAASIAKEKTEELDEVLRLELQRVLKSKADIKKATQALVDLKRVLNNAEISAQIGDVENESVVESAQSRAHLALEKAQAFFSSDNLDDHDGESSNQPKALRMMDHLRDVMRECNLAVSSYENLVAQEVQSRKEAQRLMRQRKLEERRKEEMEAKEQRKREEDLAKIREKAAMMLDPASSKFANIQGLIELQGITNVPIIQERLENARKALANAQTQLLSGDPNLAITATQATVQMVDHLEDTFNNVKIEKSKYMINRRKKQLHYTRLLSAVQLYEDCENFLANNEVNDVDIVQEMMARAKEALEKAQDSCKIDNFEFSLGFEDVSEYVPVELVDANVRTALSLTELAKKTAYREGKIAKEKVLLEKKIVRDKRYMNEALSKFDYALQKLSALKARCQIKMVQEVFADKNVVTDVLQSAEAAIQCAESKVSDSHDEPAAIHAAVVFAVDKVNEASKAIDREETRLIVQNRRYYEKTKKANAHRKNNRDKVLHYIKGSRSTKQLFRNLNFTSNRSSIMRKVSVRNENSSESDDESSNSYTDETSSNPKDTALVDGYFTKRREDLLTTQDGPAKINEGRKRRKESYHLKLTPAMIRLLPEHARRKYFDTDKTNIQKDYDGDKESQISETTETLESNARSTRNPPPPTVPLNGIQAQLQERLRAISEKNKSIQIKSDAVRDTPFPRKEDFVQSGGSSNSKLSYLKGATNDFHEKEMKSNDAKMAQRLPKNKNSTPLIPPPEAMSMEDSTTSVEEMGTNEAYDEGGAHDIGSDQFEINRSGNGNESAPRQLSPSTFVVNEIENFDEVAKNRILQLIAGVIHKQKGLFGRIIENIRVAFRRYDRKGDGLIYLSQFEQAVDGLDLHLNRNQKQSLLRAMNTRDDGCVEYECLLRALKLKRTALLRNMSEDERKHRFGNSRIPRQRGTKFQPPYKKRGVNDWNSSITKKLKMNDIPARHVDALNRAYRLAQQAKRFSYSTED